MYKFILLIIASFILAQNSSAISIVKTFNDVTKENSPSFGIEVHFVPKNIYCLNGIEVWISAPKKAKRGYFNLGTSTGRPVISGAISIQEYIEEPILATGATYTSGNIDQDLIELQRHYNFRATGFRGALLCIDESQLKNTNFEFDDRGPNGLITTNWNMGALDKWRN
jgi:hypothetical protein